MGNEGRAARKEGLLAVVKNTAGPRRAARCYFDGDGSEYSWAEEKKSSCRRLTLQRGGGCCGGGGDGGCGALVAAVARVCLRNCEGKRKERCGSTGQREKQLEMQLGNNFCSEV